MNITHIFSYRIWGQTYHISSKQWQRSWLNS